MRFFSKYSYKEWRLFVEAYLGITLGRLAIWLLSFKKIARRLGTVSMETTAAPAPVTADLAAIEEAVARAGRHALLTSNCFDQALSAKMMLRRRRISSTIYFGVMKDEQNKLNAHAWVRAHERIITGKKGMERFTVVAKFGR